MNNPNPLVPQGSMLEEKARSKTSLPVAFFIFFALHVIVLGGVLMVGCSKNEDPSAAKKTTLPPLTNDLPPLDTNTVYTPPPPLTNASTAAGYPPTGSGSGVQPGLGSGTSIAPTSGTSTNPVGLPAYTESTSTSQGEVPAGGVAEGMIEYKVAKNDTFAIIAKKHRTTIKAVEQANPGVQSSKLKVGQKLNVPAGSSTAKHASSSTSDSNGMESAPGSVKPHVYTVKAGDNLTKIAKAHGTTAKAVRGLNGLKTDRITVGQKLKMPAAKSAGTAGNSASAEPTPDTSVPAAGGLRPSGAANPNPLGSPQP